METRFKTTAGDVTLPPGQTQGTVDGIDGIDVTFRVEPVPFVATSSVSGPEVVTQDGPHNQIESKPAIEAEVVESETKESANRL